MKLKMLSMVILLIMTYWMKTDKTSLVWVMAIKQTFIISADKNKKFDASTELAADVIEASPLTTTRLLQRTLNRSP